MVDQTPRGIQASREEMAEVPAPNVVLGMFFGTLIGFGYHQVHNIVSYLYEVYPAAMVGVAASVLAVLLIFGLLYFWRRKGQPARPVAVQGVRREPEFEARRPSEEGYSEAVAEEGIGSHGAEHPPFELQAPAELSASTQRRRRQKRTKPLSPDELWAQPQFKLPIAGGKAKEGILKPKPSSPSIEIELDQDSSVRPAQAGAHD
jgi:hypothetical protein